MNFKPIPFEEWIKNNPGFHNVNQRFVECENCNGTGKCECCNCESEHSCGICDGKGKFDAAIVDYNRQVDIDREKWKLITGGK